MTTDLPGCDVPDIVGEFELNETETMVFFGSKIAAVNFRKLFGYRKGLGNYVQNPLISAI